MPWCLLEAQRDRGADQVEGAPLVWGGGGELVYRLAGDADGVAGQGGQVVDQAAEAAQRLVAGSGLGGGFGVGGWGPPGRGDGIGPGGCSSA